MTTKRGLIALAISAIAMTLVVTDDAQARFRRSRSCGSWGGSGGSGGSWGGRGWGGSHGSFGSHGGSYNRGCGSHGGGYQTNNCGCNGTTVEYQEDHGNRHEANYRGPEMNVPRQTINGQTGESADVRPSLRHSGPADERDSVRSRDFTTNEAPPRDDRPTSSNDENRSSTDRDDEEKADASEESNGKSAADKENVDENSDKD